MSAIVFIAGVVACLMYFLEYTFLQSVVYSFLAFVGIIAILLLLVGGIAVLIEVLEKKK